MSETPDTTDFPFDPAHHPEDNRFRPPCPDCGCKDRKLEIRGRTEYMLCAQCGKVLGQLPAYGILKPSK